MTTETGTAVEAIRARLDAVPDSPWSVTREELWSADQQCDVEYAAVCLGAATPRCADDCEHIAVTFLRDSREEAQTLAAFIANAPADIRALLDLNAALTEALEAALPAVAYEADENRGGPTYFPGALEAVQHALTLARGGA